jgi:hypothetical protein
MNTRDLDGRTIKWRPTGLSTKDQRPKSSLHKLAKEMLHKKYPTMQILEEVSVPLRARQTVYLDFYCPMTNRAYEVHGEQHYKFVSRFHADAAAFAKQQARDRDKREWCDINGITLTELPFDYIENWEDLI